MKNCGAHNNNVIINETRLMLNKLGQYDTFKIVNFDRMVGCCYIKMELHFASRSMVPVRQRTTLRDVA